MHVTNVYCYVPKYLDWKLLVFQRHGGNCKIRVGVFSSFSNKETETDFFKYGFRVCWDTINKINKLNKSYLMLISKEESIHFNIKHIKDIFKTF